MESGEKKSRDEGSFIIQMAFHFQSTRKPWDQRIRSGDLQGCWVKPLGRTMNRCRMEEGRSETHLVDVRFGACHVADDGLDESRDFSHNVNLFDKPDFFTRLADWDREIST